ncbi:MAG: WD40 repeat domain-containing protein, partial [Aggregatilineales bacterium]
MNNTNNESHNQDFFDQFHKDPSPEFAQDLLARLNVLDAMNQQEKAHSVTPKNRIYRLGQSLRGTPAILVAAMMALLFAGMILVNSLQTQNDSLSQIEDVSLNNLQPISLANVSDMQRLRQLGRGTLYDMAWSPDESTIAVASGSGVYLHSALDFSDLGILPGTEGESIRALTYSNDGTKIAASLRDSEEIVIWDSATLEVLTRIILADTIPFDLIFDATGENLAVLMCFRGGSNRSGCGTVGALFYNVFSGELTNEIRADIDYSFLTSLAISPDWSLLAFVGGGSLYIWDVQTGEQIREIESRTVSGGFPHTVAFSPDSTQLAMSVSNAGALRIFDVETLLNVDTDIDLMRDATTLEVASPAEEGIYQVWNIHFNADGSRVFATDFDGGVVAWSLPDGELINVVQVGPRQTPGRVSFLTVNSSGTEIVTSLNGALAKFNVDDSSQLALLYEYSMNTPNQFSFSADHMHLVTGSRNNWLTYANLWDLTAETITPQRINDPQIDPDSAYVTLANINPDGTEVAFSSVSPTGAVQFMIHDVATGDVEPLPDQRYWENRSEAYFDTNNDVFMLTDMSDTEIQHWIRNEDAEAIRESVELQADEGNVYFHPTLNTTVDITNSPSNSIRPIAVDPSNRLMVATVCTEAYRSINIRDCSATLGVWDRATGALLMALPDSNYEFDLYEATTTMSFSPDGNTLAVGSCLEYQQAEDAPNVLCQSSGVRLWDVSAAYAALDDETQTDLSVADPFVRIDVPTPYPLPQVAFSPTQTDGNVMLAVADNDNTTFYDVNTVTGEYTIVNIIAGAEYPEFSPDGELLALSRAGV